MAPYMARPPSAIPSAESSVTPTRNGPEPIPGDALEARAPESAAMHANAQAMKAADFLTRVFSVVPVDPLSRITSFEARRSDARGGPATPAGREHRRAGQRRSAPDRS